MGDDNGRRYPRNLQGLLSFCTEYTRTEDASGNNVQEMSPERRKWLEEALASLRGEDPIKVLLEHIQILLDHTWVEEDHETALDNIKEYCEDLDLANDFNKIGGAHLIHKLLTQQYGSGVRWRAADLVGTLAQNNPTAQAELQSTLSCLLGYMDKPTESELVRVKCLYAISCLVRSNEDTLKEFLRLDGLSYLLRAMQTNIDKLQIKSAFMLSSLCQSSPSIKDDLCNMGMVEQMVALLHTEHSPFHEQLLAALYALTAEHSLSQSQCVRPELQLRQLLAEKRRFLAGKPEFEEELHYVEQLWNLLHFNSTESSLADR